MARKVSRTRPSDAANVKLPGAALHMARRASALWGLSHLGEKQAGRSARCAHATPDSPRTRHCASSEGRRIRMHAERGRRESVRRTRVRSTLAITAVGWFTGDKRPDWVPISLTRGLVTR